MKMIESLKGDHGIGDIRAIHSAFSFRVPGTIKNHRLLNTHLAGGGLLDTGIYNFHFANACLGKISVKTVGLASIGTDEHHIEVDEQACYIAMYDQGELVSMSSGVRTNMQDTARIYGTKGYIEIPVFWKPTEMTVVIDGKEERQELRVLQRIGGIEDEGYQYEIAHVNDCLRKGLRESPVVTWEESLSVIKQCDELRGRWGLKYPFE